MPYNIFLYFIAASILSAILTGIFFSIQKKNIVSIYQQANSQELKNIYGTIITESGFLRKNIQFCRFDILINQHSIFIFPMNFYLIPSRPIHLIFSDSNKVQTRRSTLLREFRITRQNIELVFYPKYLITGNRKVYLKSLSQDQVLILESVLKDKSTRKY